MSSDNETEEEAFILEKKEISVDDDEDYEYGSIKSSDDEDIQLESEEEENDLDDFEKLKAHTKLRILQQTDNQATSKPELKPKLIKREIVIDDYIRNFM